MTVGDIRDIMMQADPWLKEDIYMRFYIIRWNLRPLAGWVRSFLDILYLEGLK